MNNKIQIKLSIVNSASNGRCIQVQAVESLKKGTKMHRSRQISLDKVPDLKKAWAIVNGFNTELAKDFNVEPAQLPPTMEDFLKMRGRMDLIGGERTTYVGSQAANKERVGSSAAANYINDMAKLRVAIKSAIAFHGFEQVIENLQRGLDYANEITKEEREKEANKNAILMKTARDIYTSRQQGVSIPHMGAEIEKFVKMVQAEEENKAIMKSKSRPLYRLNGTDWDGEGNAPASFKKFLRDSGQDLEALRVM
ncbi:hypothetical protein [Bowmanella sp. JS7-9]|uniref:Uncharacterized protein n=1 Tax=Pseudobowmanella zhangzhouensis TaxID=1537679 RepID=A0ABW1XMY1_9ALTE|nr:hypothetical protein [Bowmanella sp. JS7-9]TBX21942.1 hypothetical protein TK45_10670 [Bowmanella sp. JS7-9]